jgi:hypothetical protein
MTTFNSIGLGRTIGAGVNLLLTSDFQLSVITSNGVVSIVLPSISSLLQARLSSGNLSLIQFIISDITANASTNNITLYAASGDSINGSSSVVLNVNNISVILTPTSNNSWSSISNVGGGTPTPPPFNSPFDFYLDAAAPNGGDGSIEFPFNTITALNNHIISLANPTQGYVGNVAPSNTGYGSEVVGSLPLAPNLSLVGLTPQNTDIGCNISLIATATGIVNQYRNLAFNGVFTIDLTLATFAAITFQNGSFNINRIDNNASGFVSLQGGIGATTIGGTVIINSGILFGDVTVNAGANLYSNNVLNLGGKFKLNGNCTLKTLSTLNASADYVDGTVDGSGTPIWITDSASDATYTGTVNKTILDWKTGGNANGSLQSIGTLDNFDFPIIVNGVEITRITTDKRQFWNDTKTNNGSNAGLQYSSTVPNRAQLRNNQYGDNTAGAGLTTFKSRGTVIGAPLQAGDGLQVGDIVQGLTAIGVTGNGLLIPLVFTQRVTVSQSNPTSLATDWTIQLCPLNGVTNSIRNVFRVTSEGIQVVRETANCMAGLAVLDAAGQIVVANSNVKANTRFLITVQDGGAVPSGSLIYQSARTIGTDFTITSKGGALDAGVQVYYQLYEPLT